MNGMTRLLSRLLAGLLLLTFPMAIPDLLFLLRPLPEQSSPIPFRFPDNRFSFANETVWNYADGELQNIGLSDEDQVAAEGERYSRRCFVLCRAALQFHKFARFDPEAPPPDSDSLTSKIQKLADIDVWKEPFPEKERILFPGFLNLAELSRRHPELLRTHLGPGWTTYVRPGNFGIPLPVSSTQQKKIHRLLDDSLDRDMPVILWLVNFPSLNINHTVLVYEKLEAEDGDGEIRYATYDPNDTTEPKILRYNPTTATFSFQPTFYFPGGPCRARAVFLSPLQ